MDHLADRAFEMRFTSTPQQFVNQSTWDPVPVQRRICARMLPLIDPAAWVIDDVSFPRTG